MNGYIPDNSLLNGVLSQIIPAAYIHRDEVGILWRTEQTLTSLLLPCFYKIQLNYLLQSPFPDPETIGHYHKDKNMMKQ